VPFYWKQSVCWAVFSRKRKSNFRN
jgi:hypothetical protein